MIKRYKDFCKQLADFFEVQQGDKIIVTFKEIKTYVNGEIVPKEFVYTVSKNYLLVEEGGIESSFSTKGLGYLFDQNYNIIRFSDQGEGI